jgi:ketosteroid isomerase-like protein
MSESTSAAVLDAEAAFFGALLNADGAALDEVLAGDFVLVDVMGGQAIPRDVLLGLVATRELEFLAVYRDLADVTVRHRRDVAVVVGRTHLVGRFQGTEFSADSRYTHVYVATDGRWEMLSAQGTREVTEPVPS